MKRICNTCQKIAAKKDIYCRWCGIKFAEDPFSTVKQLVKLITRPIIRSRSTGPTTCPTCTDLEAHKTWKYCTECGRKLK